MPNLVFISSLLAPFQWKLSVWYPYPSLPPIASLSNSSSRFATDKPMLWIVLLIHLSLLIQTCLCQASLFQASSSLWLIPARADKEKLMTMWANWCITQQPELSQYRLCLYQKDSLRHRPNGKLQNCHRPHGRHLGHRSPHPWSQLPPCVCIRQALGGLRV